MKVSGEAARTEFQSEFSFCHVLMAKCYLNDERRTLSDQRTKAKQKLGSLQLGTDNELIKIQI
jgi:hypothetical protein